MLTLGFYFFLKGLDSARRQFFILSGLVLALLVFTHPFDFQIFFSVIFLFFLADWFFNKMPLPVLLLPLLVTLPFLAFQFCASLANTVFKEHAFGVIATGSSNFIFYVWGLGFLSLLTLLGIAELLSNTFDRLTKQRYLFITLWIIAVPVLLYLPTTFQGRAAAGIQLPACILSVYGIERIIGRFKLNTTIVWAAIFLMTLPANPMLFMHNMSNLERAKGFEYKIAPFLDRGIYEAVIWLSKNTSEDDVIFCDWNIGNYIPSVPGNTVFVGHGLQTIDFDKKQKMVERFFSENASDTERRAILVFSNSDFVFYSFKEKQFGGFDPDKAKYLKMVYNNQGVKIYEIIKPLL